MLWTLIVTLTLSSNHPQKGESTSGYAVYGFQSESACLKAGDRVPVPSGGSWSKGSASYVCVPMWNVK